eukprot:CAMPEP_0180578350 /NCGR_PEP_ID=MMETSP1037_2-20121125/12418_1 /TAXON_ID=632150 /ORGANISM="Azadinium spinosum, Strain 3D9" /LENGTH=202 /DNA_ID=CAMNT_0022596153 /DNA_START=128 /DNA_END=737 /DNA_ORIENTATION=+
MHDIAVVIHGKLALEQSGLRIMPDRQKGTSKFHSLVHAVISRIPQLRTDQAAVVMEPPSHFAPWLDNDIWIAMRAFNHQRRGFELFPTVNYVTVLAKRARNSASSTAVSPPPTTITSSSKYNAPSQTAHVEIRDASAFDGLLLWSSKPSGCSACGDDHCICLHDRLCDRSTASTIRSLISVPNLSACLRRSAIICGPETASG